MKYKIRTESIQLIQLLKVVNISNSGGQAKLMVEDGEVKVNGEVDFRKRAKLFPGDKIEIFDQIIEIE
ncbi:MAG: RNA-binding S4 domain-containing protein [Bacteroidales bacterium]|nr:RNA-binding S4 domain-containing protein [Bacteroidales bacterium]MCF8458476.1 RNA-binding S4 domain-containing protein [Bacteroidales bacterium]